MRTVKFPVPGPTSSTLSVGRRPAYGSMRAVVSTEPSSSSVQGLTKSTILRKDSLSKHHVDRVSQDIRLSCLRVLQNMLAEPLGVEERIPRDRGTGRIGRGFRLCGWLMRTVKLVRRCARHCDTRRRDTKAKLARSSGVSRGSKQALQYILPSSLQQIAGRTPRGACERQPRIYRAPRFLDLLLQ